MKTWRAAAVAALVGMLLLVSGCSLMPDGGENEAHRYLLYNLRTDISETNDLADAKPELVRQLDALIEDYPTYAEAWNQRATTYYMMQNFEASLADIDKTLELEPRHFGALSGQSLILLAQGKRDQALKAIIAALAIHPFLSERGLFPELAREVTRI